MTKKTSAFGIQNTHHLVGNYTYYKRLLTDDHDGSTAAISTYTRNLSNMNTFIEANTNYGEIAAYFNACAQNELNKEKALIRSMLGTSAADLFKSDYGTPEFAKELITTINEMLQFEGAFRNALTLMKHSKENKKSYKSRISWIMKSFREDWIKTGEKELSDYLRNNMNTIITDPVKYLQTYTYQIVRKYLRQVLIHAFSEARSEYGFDDIDNEAYRCIANILSDTNSPVAKKILTQFIDNLGLKKLYQGIATQSVNLFKTPKKSQETISKITNEVLLSTNQYVYSTGGLAYENLMNTMASLVLSGYKNAGTILTGGTKQKSDITIGFGIPMDKLEKLIKEYEWGTRELDAEAIREIEAEFSRFSNGFIVYINAKNYGLGSNFGGFSSGSDLSIGNFQKALVAGGLSNKNAQNLVRVAMQLGSGAIGEELKPKVELLYARAVAAFLFDDFKVIGEDMGSQLNRIHLLSLSGVYVPLSFFFQQLANAFQSFDDNTINKLVNVKINAPEILWPKENDFTYDGNDSKIAWKMQAEHTLANTSISAKFLKNILDVLSGTGLF